MDFEQVNKRKKVTFKVYIQIFKYWSRLSTSENELLKASMEANMVLDQQGHQNWLKVIQNLLKVTNITWSPSKNEIENRRAVKSFEQKVRQKSRVKVCIVFGSFLTDTIIESFCSYM